MASKKSKRSSRRPPRTAIVPRVVFQTMVAMSVVPAASVIAGCGQSTTATTDAGDSGFSVAAPLDGGRDTGFFSVVAAPDAGRDTGFFAVVAAPDSGFSVAVPLDGAFSVLVAPFDANTSS